MSNSSEKFPNKWPYIHCAMRETSTLDSPTTFRSPVAIAAIAYENAIPYNKFL
jgi:hypothetical protein